MDEKHTKYGFLKSYEYPIKGIHPNTFKMHQIKLNNEETEFLYNQLKEFRRNKRECIGYGDEN
ncbi:hypothetical protein [Bacillus alkalicellulosilyticus]|uniref:hypothetical protein n=1 Tax=Alkalihalobacterium alkalicellulosilyticum TaxID=1912214 RepID=UPI000998A4E5|nr:hypothetical protein [Bacillus alkalicellulosilyticus]